MYNDIMKQSTESICRLKTSTLVSLETSTLDDVTVDNSTIFIQYCGPLSISLDCKSVRYKISCLYRNCFRRYQTVTD